MKRLFALLILFAQARLVLAWEPEGHQTVVSTGYYNVDDNGKVTLITDPAQAGGKPDDVGGNDLFYGPGRFDELHGYWDGPLVEKVNSTSSYHKLATFLSDKVDQTSSKTPGDYHQWAEAWASDSVQIAATAYSGLTFSNPVFNTHHGLRQIFIVLPNNHESDRTKCVKQQLIKAGAISPNCSTTSNGHPTGCTLAS